MNNEKEQYELEWDENERKEVEKRILNLRDDQLAALLNLVGLGFSLNDIEEVVEEIKTNKHESGHLPILIEEAESKEVLLWWVEFFEKHNRK